MIIYYGDNKYVCHNNVTMHYNNDIIMHGLTIIIWISMTVTVFNNY